MGGGGSWHLLTDPINVILLFCTLVSLFKIQVQLKQTNKQNSGKMIQTDLI